jgi:hypothetical protein
MQFLSEFGDFLIRVAVTAFAEITLSPSIPRPFTDLTIVGWTGRGKRTLLRVLHYLGVRLEFET